MRTGNTRKDGRRGWMLAVAVEVVRKRTPAEVTVRVWDAADGRLWAEDASWTENRVEWLRAGR